MVKVQRLFAKTNLKIPICRTEPKTECRKTDRKPLKQLRAEKERAETRLAQEQHKLERQENRKKYLEQCVQILISTEVKKDHAAQRGCGACGTATRIMRIAVPQALCVLREYTGSRRKSGKVCRSDIRLHRGFETCETVRG